MKAILRKTSQFPVIDVKRYGGKQIAVVDGKIVAFGQTLGAVLEKVRTRFPAKPLSEIKVFSVPKTLSVIYYYARW